MFTGKYLQSFLGFVFWRKITVPRCPIFWNEASLYVEQLKEKCIFCTLPYTLYCHIATYAWHYNAGTQKSHDHLFYRHFCHQIQSKSEKVRFCDDSVPKFVSSRVNCLQYIFTYAWHYNSGTQKSHDNLFKKSGRPWFSHFSTQYSQNSKKCGSIITLSQICYQSGKLFTLHWHTCPTL